MDPRTLVTRDVAESGRRLLERLAGTEVAPLAAMWAQRAERDERPYLFIVTPVLQTQGPIKAYTAVGNAVRAVNAEAGDPFAEIEPSAVKLLGPSEPLAEGLLIWDRRHPDDRPTFHNGPSMGGILIDAAYSYPATMFAPQAA